MDGKKGGWVGGRKGVWRVAEWMKGRKNRWIDGRYMTGWMDGWLAGQTDGWMWLWAAEPLPSSGPALAFLPS
jgi:hypothetical protein